jgi:predicted ribosomally synthesized peptide with nif11-like leader
MSQNNAAEFLRKLDTDTAIRSKVAEGYRRLLIETGKDAGLEFTSEDLRNAAFVFSEGAYREISDTDLAMIAGGADGDENLGKFLHHWGENRTPSS